MDHRRISFDSAVEILVVNLNDLRVIVSKKNLGLPTTTPQPLRCDSEIIKHMNNALRTPER
jgi:hypothetical protein